MLKYKKCQNCKKRIIEEMDKCPWCGKVQIKKNHKKTIKIIFTIVLLIIIIIFVQQKGYTITIIRQKVDEFQKSINQGIKKPIEVPAQTPLDTLNSETNKIDKNNSIETNISKDENSRSKVDDGVIISIEDIQIQHSIGKFLTKTAREDAIFVVITWNVKNITEQIVSLGRDMALYSPKGLKYTSSMFSILYVGIEDTGIEPLPSEGLSPGIKYRTSSVFEVSQDQINKSGWYIKVRNSSFKM